MSNNQTTIESRQPGHALVLQPGGHGLFKLACACGGLLEPMPDTEEAHRERHHRHLTEIPTNSTP
ncbi:hypothetical protein ACFYNX_26495 [Streptomyces sp. NPDC007872]|uniref:hypothetical protein n=1 Tax=Streptomyces sp. NPDC007872 TaxID=3364782 RepID=UPI003682E85C